MTEIDVAAPFPEQGGKVVFKVESAGMTSQITETVLDYQPDKLQLLQMEGMLLGARSLGADPGGRWDAPDRDVSLRAPGRSDRQGRRRAHRQAHEYQESRTSAHQLQSAGGTPVAAPVRGPGLSPPTPRTGGHASGSPPILIPMHDLTSTAGIVAMAAAAVAVVAFLIGLGLAIALRRLRGDQQLVLGDRRQDLVSHAAALERQFAAFHQYVEDAAARLNNRMETAEHRIDCTLAYRSLVRYDAYGEMSGRQSTSIALLDATRSGIALLDPSPRSGASVRQAGPRRGPALEFSPEERGDPARPRRHRILVAPRTEPCASETLGPRARSRMRR